VPHYKHIRDVDEQERPVMTIALDWGIGDCVFQSAFLMEKFNRLNYPCFDIVSYKQFPLDISLYAPYVASLNLVSPSNYLNILEHLGRRHFDLTCKYHEGFDFLGLENTPFSERKIITFCNSEQLRHSSCQLSRKFGNDKKRVLFQTEGADTNPSPLGFKTSKKYSKINQVASEIVDFADFMFLSKHANGDHFIESYKGSIKIESIEHLIHLLPSFDVFVGFDSGPSYLSISLNISTVILSGVVDVKSLMFGLEGNSGYSILRTDKTTEECFIECKKLHSNRKLCMSDVDSSLDSRVLYCPIRDNGGCDFIDDIEVSNVVMKIKEML
jgi:hypothetical protein